MTEGAIAEIKPKYEIDAQLITKQSRGLVALCPHVIDGKKCNGVVSTIGAFPDNEAGQLVVRSDEQAVAVYLAGKTINLTCGQCGSLLKVRKSLLTMPNDGPNRHARRANLKLV